MTLELSTPPAPSKFARVGWVLAASAVLAAAAGGGRLIMQATHEGPGLSPDTRGYLEMARSLIAGHGLSHYNGDLVLVPETHFPPLFSMTIAAILRGGLEFEHGIRWLNVGLFIINAVLAAMVVARSVPPAHRILGALVGGVLCALSPVLVHVYSMAWSEPLFFTFALLMILLLGTYLERTDRRWLLASGVTAALALLTRYAGMSLVFAAAIAILSGGRRRVAMRRRTMDTLLFGTVACVPLVVWLVRNIALTGRATDRAVVFHASWVSEAQMAVVTFADWVAPTSDKPMVAGAWPRLESTCAAASVVLALTAWIVCFVLRKREKPEGRSGSLSLLLWFVPLYVLFLGVSITWLDAATEVDFRILCPLYLAMQLLVVTGVFLLFNVMQSRIASIARWVIVVAAVALGVFESQRTFEWSSNMRRHGLGYHSPVWRNSQVIQFVKKIPADSVIYTNAPDVIYLLQDRLAKPIPKTFLPGSFTEVGLRRAFNGFRKDMSEHNGYLLMFAAVSREYMVSEDRLQKRFRLQAVFSGKDGVVYRLPDAATAPTTASLHPAEAKP